jgi:hypothetical protein
VTGGIFLRRGDEMVEMVEMPYALEDDFQRLLAEHPGLLAGDQFDREVPRKWLLVAREVAVASEQDGSGRWSLDHLFLDQDAVPTIVEVKRSVDTRIRREVVGQMLDYAANAVVYWDIDVLRVRFEEAHAAAGKDTLHEIEAVVGAEADVAAFWAQAKANLLAGRVRLVFVADEIPTELQRIVEFLNERMTPTEVLALEIKRYVHGDHETLVPRLIGRTAAAADVKQPSRGERWSEARILGRLEKRDPAEARVAREIFAWARRHGLRLAFGQGRFEGSAYPVADRADGQSFWPIAVWTTGIVELQFGSMASRPPFDDEGKRRELWSRLNALDGVEFPFRPFPNFPLSVLGDDAVRRSFFEVLEWSIVEFS